MIQSISQLSKYGHEEAKTIRENCFTHVYLGPQQSENAKYLENALGKQDIRDDQGRLVRVLPLMQQQELQQLSTEESVILKGGFPPVKCRVHPYFRSFWLKQKVEAHKGIVRHPVASEYTIPRIEELLPERQMSA